MPKIMTRRDILKLVGGSALGIFFTPVPWKLLDDTSIWTQNWSLIPALPHGELTERFTACTLCPASCGVRATCVAGTPFALSGVPAHPISRGYLCAAGLAGHHLAHHPLRITSPARFAGKGTGARMESITPEAAISEIAGKIKARDGRIAVLDLRPGRALSGHYQEFLAAVGQGQYVASPSREDVTLATLAAMLDAPQADLGYDFDHASLVVSFGAPLLEGWGAPGQLTALRSRNNAGGFRLLQVEHRQSRTALGAELWIPIAPGSEELFALTIANVLLSTDRPVSSTITDLEVYRALVASCTPERTESRTGVAPALARRVGAELASARSPIVLGSADPGGGPLGRHADTAIAGLNILLGTIGKEGGIVARNGMPGASPLDMRALDLRDVPDGSLSLLLVDAAPAGYAIHQDLLRRKLRPGSGLLVALASSWNDIAAHADIVLPLSAPYELLQEVASPAGTPVASYGLASPLLPARAYALDPASIVARIATASGVSIGAACTSDLLKKRAETIFAAGRGAIVSPAGASKRLSDCSGPDAFWSALESGQTWIDDPASQTVIVPRSLASAGLTPSDEHAVPSAELTLIPYGWKGAVSGAEISPILSKVFQESSLRDITGTIRMNPGTAAELALEANMPVVLETPRGSTPATLRLDAGVRPGVVLAAVGPVPEGRAETRILDLCDVREDGSWRMTHTTVRKG